MESRSATVHIRIICCLPVKQTMIAISCVFTWAQTQPGETVPPADVRSERGKAAENRLPFHKDRTKRVRGSRGDRSGERTLAWQLIMSCEITTLKCSQLVQTSEAEPVSVAPEEATCIILCTVFVSALCKYCQTKPELPEGHPGGHVALCLRFSVSAALPAKWGKPALPSSRPASISSLRIEMFCWRSVEFIPVHRRSFRVFCLISFTFSILGSMFFLCIFKA